jgi:tetratricopeptide (TPR) repeat protein
MILLPTSDERQWLTHALRKLIVRRGMQMLDETPLVEPTNEWFPEKWSTTAAHGHRLAQRLLYYAGLGALRPTLSAFAAQQSADGSTPWDAGTAGWFAGIENGKVHFGLHVRQFGDPEAAAGVLAHEVAHAWRAHHHLTIDDRDKEELLTDVTTVVLGFGILSTNNTDRYRTTGTWSVTAWSRSSAGYLPPPAMAYLLALWCTAREKDEQRIIERHLEPNQRACFRAALNEIANSGESIREHFTRSAPSRPLGVVRPESFVPTDPRPDEIAEPVLVKREETARTVYRTPKGSTGTHLYVGTIAGFFVGFLIGVSISEDEMQGVWIGIAAALVLDAFLLRRTRRHVCSHCATFLAKDIAVCPGCNGTIDRFVTARELQKIRLDEFDRRAARDVDYDECDACEPERPCPKHMGTERIGPDEPEPEEEDEPRSPREVTPPPRIGRAFAMVAALVLIATFGFAWWRQNHVAVYFDNVLNRPLVVSVDGTSFALDRRTVQKYAPGVHHIVVRQGAGVLESFDATIRRQSFIDALLSPRFYVYSADSAGIYERARYVYSTNPGERVSETHLIGLERWIEQDDASYVFAGVPDSVPSSRATRTSFDAAPATGFRELAYAWYRENRIDDAVRAVRKGLQTQPCDEGLRGDLLALLQAGDQRARAVEESGVWISRCDDSIAAHRAYQGLKEKPALLEIYRMRLEKNGSAANHYLYGRLLSGPRAIDEFQEALRLDPSLNWARVALGHELLGAERDREAFEVLDQALQADEVPSSAPRAYALAAIATNHVDEAWNALSGASNLDPLETWWAKWTLAFAKKDWDEARVLLVEREQGTLTTETRILRARLNRESGTLFQDVIADLRKEPETSEAARVFLLENALENERLAEAAAMKELPDENLVYAAEAGLLAGTPVKVMLTDPFSIALLGAAVGTIDEATLLASADDVGVEMRTHAFFALGVHAASRGDKAKAAHYFRKSAERALSREFPYRAALRLAERYGRNAAVAAAE